MCFGNSVNPCLPTENYPKQSYPVKSKLCKVLKFSDIFQIYFEKVLLFFSFWMLGVEELSYF